MPARPGEFRRRFGEAGWQVVRAERVAAEAIGIAVGRTADGFELWRHQLQRASD